MASSAGWTPCSPRFTRRSQRSFRGCRSNLPSICWRRSSAGRLGSWEASSGLRRGSSRAGIPAAGSGTSPTSSRNRDRSFCIRRRVGALATIFDGLQEYVDACMEVDEYRIIEGADWNEEIGALIEATAELIDNPPMLLFDKVKD